MGDMMGGDGERPDRASDKFPADLAEQLTNLIVDDDGYVAGFEEIVARKVIAKFNAVFARLNVTKSGDMLFVLLVPGKQKYEAMKASDYPDKLLTVELTEYVEEYSAATEQLAAELGVDMSPTPEAVQDDGYVKNWQREHYRDPDDDVYDDVVGGGGDDEYGGA